MFLFPIEDIRTCCKCGKRIIHTSNIAEFDLGNSVCDQCDTYLDYEFTTRTLSNNSGMTLSNKTEGENNDD